MDTDVQDQCTQMNSRTDSMDIQQDSTDTQKWMCRDPCGETGL